jgi:hypothetical protein
LAAGRRRHEAVVAIERSGGRVEYADEFDEFGGHAGPSLGRRPPGPWCLRKLLGDEFFRNVVTAVVKSDGDFAYLKRFDQLKEVRCARGVTEAGLERLKEVPQLRCLGIGGHRVRGPKMRIITALPNLEELDLSYTDVGDAELEQLKTLTHLHTLYLLNTRITDAGMRHLEAISSLEALLLWRTRVGDAGVEHLKRLTHLKELDLIQTRITDAALEQLAGMRQLEDLDLRFTHISQEGFRKIKRALPGCNVHFVPIIDPRARDLSSEGIYYDPDLE